MQRTVVFALLGCLCGAACAEPLPAEWFGRLPAIFDAAISPDGTKLIVAATTESGESGLIVYRTSDSETLFASRISESRDIREQSNLRGVGWADDDHATFTISVTVSSSKVTPTHVFTPGTSRLDYWRAGILDLRSERMYYVSTGDKDTEWKLQNLSRLVAPIQGDARNGRMVARTGPFRTDVVAAYRINLDSGRRAMLRRGTGNTLDFVFDAAGNPVARIDANEQTNQWSIVALGGKQERVVSSGVSAAGFPLDVSGILPDGRLAGIDRVLDADRQVFFSLDPADGASRIEFEAPSHDLGRLLEDPWTHEVVGVQWQDEETRQYFTDAALARVYAEARARVPSAILLFESWARDRSRFVVYMETSSDGGGYYLFRPGPAEWLRIGMRYPDLPPSAFGERQAITFPARDGTRIPAYLTLPSGTEPRNLPLVVLVHGGPTARDAFEFDWWASFLASRGYAVVQPNFRGSGGYGREWERAGYRQWGALMQTDVEDAALVLSRTGLADPERICIVGASYGGYAALAGAALTPERYRCAAAVAGVSDLPMMLENVELRSGSQSMSADWWRMLIGDRHDEQERLRAISPAYQARAVRAAVLLVHGANDTVVPVSQSRRMKSALRKAGARVRLVEYPGEDHWLSDAPTRIAMLRELDTFLAEHLGTAAAP